MIPFNEHPNFNLDECYHLKDGLNELAANGRVTGGRIVTEFEGMVKDLYDVDYAISFGSGTMALYSSVKYLHSLDEEYIFLPSFTWDSVFWAVDAAKFKPIYCDIDPDTYHISEDIIPFPYGKTLMLMDTFGSLCPSNKSFGENVIVDASHSFGTPRKELRGLVEAFSLNGGKVITAGEGGMAITNDRGAAQSLIKTRNLLSRMPVLCAATGLEWLEMMDDILKTKRDIAEIYNRLLHRTFVRQKIPIATNHYIYACRHPRSQEIINALKGHIDCRKYYYPAMGESKYIENANRVGKELICLPNGYYVNAEMVARILNNLSDTLEV